MKPQIVEGNWEVKASGNISNSTLKFTVRRKVWERLGFKCVVSVEISYGLIVLSHNSPLPLHVIQAIRGAAAKMITEGSVFTELIHA
jgi:hypothetical protein